MAILIGLKLLRVAPLVSSTAGLMCAWDQQFAFRSFTDPEMPDDVAGAAMPRWLSAFFRPLIWVVSILHPLGGLLGILNACGGAGDVLDAGTRWLYLAGGSFALGHLAYGKTAMGMVNTMRDKSLSRKATLRALDCWLGLNLWRIMTNNVPAWGFFLAALLRSIEVAGV